MHISHSISRRSVVIGLLMSVALVLCGMSWATLTTLELDFQQRKADHERRLQEHREEFESRVVNAMYRLVRFDEQIGREKEQPFEFFNPLYFPPGAVDGESGLPLRKPVLLPSPLAASQKRDWVLLHFHAMWPDKWASPEVGLNEDWAKSVAEVREDGWSDEPTAANWLTTLRTRYDDPMRLVQKAQIAEMRDSGESGAQAAAEMAERESENAKDAKTDKSRMVREIKRIVERLRDRQSEHEHTEACERQAIIIANLIPGHYPTVDVNPDEECQFFIGSKMFPVWLDVTQDGTEQLALLRYISLPQIDVTESECPLVVQGVLIDWEQLRSDLEAEVRADDLLKNARIVKRSAGEPWAPTHLHHIPAKIVADLPTPPNIAAASYDVMWGLGLAWVVLLAALGGLIYGTIKYLGLIERRMRFTAAVTHELRTPLTSFQLYTDLLSELDENDHSRRRKYLTTLQNESKRLSSLVENVLVYSKVNDAATSMRPRSVTPKEILDDLREETLRRCEESDRTLVISDRTNAESELETDPEFVRQILASLVDNACKYSGTTGPIWIDATSTRGGVTFEVDDAGRGVDPHETREIFEPFRRGRDAADTRAGGMGLGLALSRYWAACLDGRLNIKRSERNGGHYSRFALDLPLRPRRA